jgi:hypothetical protein
VNDKALTQWGAFAPKERTIERKKVVEQPKSISRFYFNLQAKYYLSNKLRKLIVLECNGLTC